MNLRLPLGGEVGRGAPYFNRNIKKDKQPPY